MPNDAPSATLPNGTRLALPRIGLGTAPLGNILAIIPEPDAEATLDAAWAGGIRYYDTAPFYGRGIAEVRLNRFLRGRPRDDYVLSTKVGRWLKRTTPDKMVGITKYFGTPSREVIHDYTYDGIMRSMEHSLERLGIDRVDVLFIHDIDPVTHGSDEISESHIRDLASSGMQALDELRRTGVTRAIGAGLNITATTERLVRDFDLDLVLLAGRYSLLEQGTLDTLYPLCREKKVGVVAAGVFNSGLLAGGATYNYARAPDDLAARARRLGEVCARHGVALPAAAIQFPGHHPAVVSTIFGAVTAPEVRANLAALAAPAPSALWRELKTSGLLDPRAPVPS